MGSTEKKYFDISYYVVKITFKRLIHWQESRASVDETTCFGSCTETETDSTTEPVLTTESTTTTQSDMTTQLQPLETGQKIYSDAFANRACDSLQKCKASQKENPLCTVNYDGNHVKFENKCVVLKFNCNKKGGEY